MATKKKAKKTIIRRQIAISPATHKALVGHVKRKIGNVYGNLGPMADRLLMKGIKEDEKGL